MQPLPLSTGPSNWSLLCRHLIALEPGWVLRQKFPRHSDSVEQPLLTDKALAVAIRGTREPSAFSSAQERRPGCVSCCVNRSSRSRSRAPFSLAFPPSVSLPQTKEKPEIPNPRCPWSLLPFATRQLLLLCRPLSSGTSPVHLTSQRSAPCWQQQTEPGLAARLGTGTTRAVPALLPGSSRGAGERWQRWDCSYRGP